MSRSISASRKRQFPEEEYLEYSDLEPFDQQVYQIARAMRVMSQMKIKPVKLTSSPSSIQKVYQALKNSTSWETGLSSKQIEHVTGLSHGTVFTALEKLIARKKVTSEKRGRRVRYYLVGEQKRE